MHSITEILENKVKPSMERLLLRTLTENANNNYLVTNVGEIIYTNGEERLQDFKKYVNPSAIIL